MRTGLSPEKTLSRWIVGAMVVLATTCAWSQDGKPLQPVALKQVLASGGGVFESRGITLLLSPNGYFIYNMALGFAGRGVNSGMLGTWKLERSTGKICMRSAPSEPLLFAAPGASTDGEGSVAFGTRELASAVIVKAGERLDGPAAVEALRSGEWAVEQHPDQEPAPSKLAPGTKFIHVAAPVERTETGINYVAHKFALGDQARNYLVLYRRGESPQSEALGQAGDVCVSAEELAFKTARTLADGEAQAIDQHVKAAVDPDTFVAPDGGGIAYQRVRPMAKTRFSTTPTTVKLILTETSKAELFAIVTDVLENGTSSFRQTTQDGKKSSVAKGLVFGTASGPGSVGELRVQVQILAQGEVHVTAISSRDPIAVNAEYPVALALANRIKRVTGGKTQ